MEGWIKTYRSLITHWIWKDSEYLKAWLYLLFRANFSDTNVLVDKMLVNVGKGQFITSLKKLSDDTGMSIQRTRTFLKLLETDQMVKLETTSKLTKITICNYDNYQDLQHSANTVPTQCQHTTNILPTTDKNIKKENNKNNEENNLLGDKSPITPRRTKFVKPTIEEIQAYCLERKNNIDPNRFFDFYESKGWKVGNSSMKDWKASIRTWEQKQNNEINFKNNGTKQSNKEAIRAKLEQAERRFNGN